VPTKGMLSAEQEIVKLEDQVLKISFGGRSALVKCPFALEFHSSLEE